MDRHYANPRSAGDRGLISAIPMLLYLRHVHPEEDMLTERFGSAYAAYQLSDVPS